MTVVHGIAVKGVEAFDGVVFIVVDVMVIVAVCGAIAVNGIVPFDGVVVAVFIVVVVMVSHCGCLWYYRRQWYCALWCCHGRCVYYGGCCG